MTVECTSCGHLIPSGQFRCGKCGAVQARDSFEDYGGLSEAGEAAVGSVPLATVDPALATSARSATPGSVEPRASEPHEEEPAREPSVPKGTFASDGPEQEPEPAVTPRASVPPPDPEARGPARQKPAENGDTGSTKSRSAAQNISQPVRVARIPVRPPYLASEILHEDLAPSEPGKQVLVRVLEASALVGLVGVLASGLDSSAAVAAGCAFVALFVLGRLDLSYPARATTAGALAGVGLGIVSWWRVALGAPLDGPLLATAATLLSAALLFRAWYRGSTTARVLVVFALMMALGWASSSTRPHDLLSLEFTWQSWLPALTWYLFILLCLLALLAFMGDETTGGCDYWAVGLFLWYAMYACVRYGLERESADQSLRAALSALGLAEPALSAPAAVALAQLLARLLGPRTRREARAARPREPAPAEP